MRVSGKIDHKNISCSKKGPPIRDAIANPQITRNSPAGRCVAECGCRWSFYWPWRADARILYGVVGLTTYGPQGLESWVSVLGSSNEQVYGVYRFVCPDEADNE